VAVIVTGVATAAVQVAVTCVACGAESCTEGSLTVQFEFTRAAVTAGHPGLPLNWNVALNFWLFAGGAALWSTVVLVGVTFKPTGPQLGELPPQPASAANAVYNISDENLFTVNMSSHPYERFSKWATSPPNFLRSIFCAYDDKNMNAKLQHPLLTMPRPFCYLVLERTNKVFCLA
jgi:hypothetical protein